MDINEARKIIDEADKEIAKQFSKRMEAVSVIADIKREKGLSIRDEKRETELLSKVASYVPDELKSSINELYETVLSVSREYQQKKLSFGLIGKTLKHSYSPVIQEMLGVNGYSLFELEEDEVKGFIRSKLFSGINVTIPYKKTVMPFLDEISTQAQKIGSVNTVIRRRDGTLFGDNTDFYGFYHLLKMSDLIQKEENVLSSGAAAHVQR